MNAADIKHFLVVLDPAEPETRVVEFGTDYDAAISAYDAEESKSASRPGVNVVLLSADSLETIKRTHSSYFESGPIEELERLLSAK